MRAAAVFVVWGALLVAACPGGTDDFDGDGTSDAEDCDPDDPAISPLADDPPGDGIDQDCDGCDGVAAVDCAGDDDDAADDDDSGGDDDDSGAGDDDDAADDDDSGGDDDDSGDDDDDDVPLGDGLVAWWSMDGTGDDLSGNGHDGSYLGTGTDVDDRCGDDGAYLFNGTDASMRVSDEDTLDLTSAVTMAAWVRRQSQFGDHWVVAKGGDWSADDPNYTLVVGSEKLYATFDGGWRGVAALPQGEWHHVVVTLEAGDAEATFYVDGVAAPQTLEGGAATISLPAGPTELYVGANLVAGAWYAELTIDEVRLYDRDLTPEEAAALAAIPPCD